jgi:hypothetical protein
MLCKILMLFENKYWRIIFYFVKTNLLGRLAEAVGTHTQHQHKHSLTHPPSQSHTHPGNRQGKGTQFSFSLHPIKPVQNNLRDIDY